MCSIIEEKREIRDAIGKERGRKKLGGEGKYEALGLHKYIYTHILK